MDDQAQLRADIQELKINVATIKQGIGDMQKGVDGTMIKIGDALILLATITEKMNANVEEHKALHKRIDDFREEISEIKHSVDTDIYEEIRKLEGKLNDLSAKHRDLEVRHDMCQEKRKYEDVEEKNSLMAKLKGRVTEWASIGFIALILYVFYAHAKEFFVFISGNGK